ncbi:quinone reductase [Coleophoma crateriformis]|uniref:Quinone reductase n=1 Tax=Coleophoma crateriformis TaxID=565419 RepID=A0A3D8QR78_9HELO|nr:quinone reductase [Coleophoma crateriformis]
MATPSDLSNQQWTSNLTGTSSLSLRTVPLSLPSCLGPNEVLVKIHSVSLNFKDAETVNGQFNHHKSISLPEEIIPCSDAAGSIFRIGAKVTRWQVGDRVMSVGVPDFWSGVLTEELLRGGIGASGKGVLCQYRVFKDYALVPTPAYMSDDEACTLQVAGTTAWMAMNGLRPLGHPGGQRETVLLQGTGGVSMQGLLIAKASGAEGMCSPLLSLPACIQAKKPPTLTRRIAKVIITSSSDRKLAQAQALGADHVINYKTTPAWDEEILRLTHGRGVDLIFENGGALTTVKSFNALKMGGTIVGIGYVSGKIDPPDERVNINVMVIKKNATYKGLINGPRERLDEMLAFYEKHQLRPVIDRVFAFEDAKAAFAYLESGGHFGKIIIKVA